MSTTTLSAPAKYENIEVNRDGPVALVRFNRPKVLNALSPALMTETVAALSELDADPEIRVVILTGNERAFAAGADIKEMAEASLIEMVYRDMIAVWDRIRQIKKPLVAAVSGFCLGGGCELAMTCDVIVASETAVFGQPEIQIGVIPGAGGTQRLTRCVGKYLAMDMVLSGRQLKASEALAHGLVCR
ncbi:MAG: enoyl-CoA hydratase/isomerase family protein, partial [Cyanobacteria bacterium REEB65]|nr:enoyl-CoA hydratase/isomerase family protein [Cyanobacteria bacterium REEB65]